MSYGSATPQRSIKMRRCGDAQSAVTLNSRGIAADSAWRNRGTVSAVIGPAVTGGLPSRRACTTGAAQHMPLQPAATTVHGRPRR